MTVYWVAMRVCTVEIGDMFKFYTKLLRVIFLKILPIKIEHNLPC